MGNQQILLPVVGLRLIEFLLTETNGLCLVLIAGLRLIVVCQTTEAGDTSQSSGTERQW